MEFAVHLSSMPDEWIPLTLLYYSDNFVDSGRDINNNKTVGDENQTITDPNNVISGMENNNTSFNEDTLMIPLLFLFGDIELCHEQYELNTLMIMILPFGYVISVIMNHFSSAGCRPAIWT